MCPRELRPARHSSQLGTRPSPLFPFPALAGQGPSRPPQEPAPRRAHLPEPKPSGGMPAPAQSPSVRTTRAGAPRSGQERA